MEVYFHSSDSAPKQKKSTQHNFVVDLRVASQLSTSHTPRYRICTHSTRSVWPHEDSFVFITLQLRKTRPTIPHSICNATDVATVAIPAATPGYDLHPHLNLISSYDCI